MQVDEALKGPLFAAREKPIDRPALIHRQMVLEEASGQIAADRLAGLLISIRAKALDDELDYILNDSCR